ncbi:MAG: hypothetical protein M1529_03050 [Candidatus Thermoplasmatota archaeon]|nr:hypothetical protein [Candidatus Thermoplasmatota archaeon]
MIISNLNSSIPAPDGIDRKVTERMSFLNTVADHVPVILVNEETMDRICPPGIGYDAHCVRELLSQYYQEKKLADAKDYPGKPEETERIWDRIVEKCRHVVFSAIGVYTENIPPVLLGIDLKDTGIGKKNSETIWETIENNSRKVVYLCPERVMEEALEISKKPQNPFDDIFLYIIFHEYTHAFITKGTNLKKYESVIEESLAAAVAYQRFSTSSEIYNISRFLSNDKLPAEYRSFTFWTEVSRALPLIAIVDKWKRGDLAFSVVGMDFDDFLISSDLFLEYGFAHFRRFNDSKGEESMLENLAIRVLMHA